jgi:hypothetical protein
VVDDALRVFLTQVPVPHARRAVSLPTGNGGGLRPGVDLEDKEQLAELLGDGEPSRADPRR